MGVFMGRSLHVGDSVGRGRMLAQVGASETHMRLPRRKAAVGSESLTQKQPVRSSPFPLFAVFPHCCSDPGWVQAAAWTRGCGSEGRRR